MESHGVAAISRDEIKVLQEQRNRLAYYLTNITGALDEFKNFNKYTCFNNIRALLKVNPDVKIGMIEKEAGVRLGYMSRLENRIIHPNQHWNLWQRQLRCLESALTF